MFRARFEKAVRDWLSSFSLSFAPPLHVLRTGDRPPNGIPEQADRPAHFHRPSRWGVLRGLALVLFRRFSPLGRGFLRFLVQPLADLLELRHHGIDVG